MDGANKFLKYFSVNGFKANFFAIIFISITGGFGGEILNYFIDVKKLDAKEESIAVRALTEAIIICRQDKELLMSRISGLEKDIDELRAEILHPKND